MNGVGMVMHNLFGQPAALFLARSPLALMNESELVDEAKMPGWHNSWLLQNARTCSTYFSFTPSFFLYPLCFCILFLCCLPSAHFTLHTYILC